MKKYNYFCLICKKEAEKVRKKGFMPSIMAWVTWDSEKEIIEHIKKSHPKEYNNIMKDIKTKRRN